MSGTVKLTEMIARLTRERAAARAEVERLKAEYHETLQMAANQAATIKQQIEEIERLQKCCTQRGARMQIMRDWLDSNQGLGPPTEWWYFCEERPEAKGWFDADGVPK